MKNQHTKYVDGMRIFALSPVAAGCAVFLAVLSSTVLAQEAPDTISKTETAQVLDANGKALTSVVVTGIRRGIEAAISIKKNSSSIVEAISAEDIGKLPDSSVAESLARLPGVTAQRTRGSGKAADISVRGLSPSFNGTLLNGREMASTGNARSPEFDLFPAELVGSATIYKTPDATVVGQGLAATIDLHTVQPLDFGKRQLVANYKKSRSGVRSGNPEGDGKRATLSYIDQFANRSLGVAVGLTRYEDSSANAKFNSWGGFALRLPYQGEQVLVPGGFTSDIETQVNKRDGAFATLQYYSKGSAFLDKNGLEGSVGGDTNEVP